MGNYIRRRTMPGQDDKWMLYEERDGLLGWLHVAPQGGWEWSTDLKGLRMAQQLEGYAPTLEAALIQFKHRYERWRARINDDTFDRVHRRSAQL